MFFERFKELCNSVNKTPTTVGKELNISSSAVSMWKNGTRTPQTTQLQKIADYFDVTVDYLLTGEHKEKPLVNNDEELTEYLEELKNRPEMKMMFSLAKGATKEDVEKAVKIIEALFDKET